MSNSHKFAYFRILLFIYKFYRQRRWDEEVDKLWEVWRFLPNYLVNNLINRLRLKYSNFPSAVTYPPETVMFCIVTITVIVKMKVAFSFHRRGMNRCVGSAGDSRHCWTNNKRELFGGWLCWLDGVLPSTNGRPHYMLLFSRQKQRDETNESRGGWKFPASESTHSVEEHAARGN